MTDVCTNLGHGIVGVSVSDKFSSVRAKRENNIAV